MRRDAGAVPLSELGLEADTAADLRRPAGLAGLFGSLLPKTSSRASSRHVSLVEMPGSCTCVGFTSFDVPLQGQAFADAVHAHS